MTFSYDKLFLLLHNRGMKKSDLRSIMAPKTVAKLSKGEPIGGEVIEKLCDYFDCQPGDIMTYVKNPSEEEVLRKMFLSYEAFQNLIAFDEFRSVAKECKHFGGLYDKEKITYEMARMWIERYEILKEHELF